MGAIMGRTLVQLFCAASSAAAMTLGYPKFPQNNMTLRLQWAGGTPPVRYPFSYPGTAH